MELMTALILNQSPSPLGCWWQIHISEATHSRHPLLCLLSAWVTTGSFHMAVRGRSCLVGSLSGWRISWLRDQQAIHCHYVNTGCSQPVVQASKSILMNILKHHIKKIWRRTPEWCSCLNFSPVITNVSIYRSPCGLTCSQCVLWPFPPSLCVMWSVS